MDETDYRIDFSITRRLPGEDEFREIGVGCSTAESSIAQAGHMAHSAIQTGEWEETDGDHG